MKSSSNRLRPRFLATLVLLFPVLASSSGCVSNYAVANDCTFATHSSSLTSSIPERLGVNIHFIDPQPGEMRMIADAGFRWVRMDFKWDATERERGSYDFSAYDRLMAALQPYNIHALFILDYGNPLYDDGAPPRTEASRQAFARWAVAAAKHFTGRGVIWEVYNEPNHLLFWPPRPNVQEYIKLALAVGRAFSATVPNEKLVGPATSGIDFPFLEACFKAGLLDYWSAVTVHPYLRSDPEMVASEYCALRQMIASYARVGTRSGSDRIIPIISGEWGYSSVWRGMSEEKQGAMFARQALTNVANDIPISIWYDWRDDGMEPNEPEHHFGLVRNPYESGRDQTLEPKPAYLAAVTLSGVFNGYKFQRRLPVGNDNDYVLVFARANDIRLAAWTTTIPHRIATPLDPGKFTITKHTGQPAGSISVGPQGLSIEVSAAPVYLTRRPPSAR
jgi:hypothetical protein